MQFSGRRTDLHSQRRESPPRQRSRCACSSIHQIRLAGYILSRRTERCQQLTRLPDSFWLPRESISHPEWRWVTVTDHCNGVFLQPLHEESDRFESLIANQSERQNRSVKAITAPIVPDATNFSVSTSVNDILGMTLEASSSTSKQSMVAMKPISPATRA